MGFIGTILAIVSGAIRWLLGRQKQQNEFTEAGKAQAQRDSAQAGISEVDKAQAARQDAVSGLASRPDTVRDAQDPNQRPFDPNATE